MKLRLKKICIFFLIILFIPQLLLAANNQIGNTKPTSVPDEDRTVWLAKGKVLKNYVNELNDMGADLADKAEDDPILQEAAERIIDIAVVLGVLETVYILNANCLQTRFTISELYKQILTASGRTSSMADYKKLKIDELYNKTKDTDVLLLIDECKITINKLQKTLADERDDLFSKLKKKSIRFI